MGFDRFCGRGLLLLVELRLRFALFGWVELLWYGTDVFVALLALIWILLDVGSLAWLLIWMLEVAIVLACLCLL